MIDGTLAARRWLRSLAGETLLPEFLRVLDRGSQVAGCFLIVPAVFVGFAERTGASFRSLEPALGKIRFQNVPSDPHPRGMAETYHRLRHEEKRCPRRGVVARSRG